MSDTEFRQDNFKENKTDFINQKYYRLTGVDGEESIAYFYFNPDALTWGFGFNIADGGGFLAVCDLKSDSLVIEVGIERKDRLTPSESIYGFAAWLTCRKEKTVMSSSDDAACIAELVDTFCKTNELDEPRDNYTDYLTHPRN